MTPHQNCLNKKILFRGHKKCFHPNETDLMKLEKYVFIQTEIYLMSDHKMCFYGKIIKKLPWH